MNRPAPQLAIRLMLETMMRRRRWNLEMADALMSALQAKPARKIVKAYADPALKKSI